MPKARLVPASGRSWLLVGGGLFLVLVGIGLTYRQVTGGTAQDQRRQAQIAKAQEELANKPPASKEGFSAVIDERRRRVEEQAAQEAAEKAAKEATGTPKPAASMAPAAGLPTAPTPEDKELEAYAIAKEARALEAAKDAARRLGTWEGGGGADSGKGGADLDAAIAAIARNAAIPPKAGAGGSGNSSGGADLLSALATKGGAGTAPAPVDQEAEFLKRVSTRSNANVGLEPIRAQRGHGRYALLEGAMIEVAMKTAVSSDIGGQCQAQVVRDVYDTVTGLDLLIPAGANLMCTYNSAVSSGQERLLMAFTRLMYPSGSTVSLGAMQGGDMLGTMGAPAEVNSRFWQVFGSSLMVATLSSWATIEQAKAQAANGSGGSNVNLNFGSQIGANTANAFSGVVSQILARNLNVKPELRLRAGDRLQVIVAHDMVLDPAITGVARTR